MRARSIKSFIICFYMKTIRAKQVKVQNSHFLFLSLLRLVNFLKKLVC